MKKALSIKRNYSSILITLIIVVSLLAYYLFIYIPDREEQIKEQRFRVLQRIDKNIQDKINNSVALLDNLLQAYNDRDVDNKVLADYINGYSKKNFTLNAIEKEPDSKNINGYKNIDSNKEAIQQIRLDANSQQFEIIVRRKEIKNGKTHVFKVSMLYSLNQFFDPLLVKNIFDEYIISAQNTVIYETFSSGLNYRKSDSLLNAHNGISASTIRDQEISGTKYKMFLQPLFFDNKSEWVLTGLLSFNRYQNERTQLPTGIVLLLITVALGIIVAFPWLKLLHMGNRNRLTLLDGAFSFMVAMLLMSLFFFGFFRYNVPFRPRDTPGCKENLANSISVAFHHEIFNARNRLYSFDSLMKEDRIYTDLTNINSATKKIVVGAMNKNDKIHLNPNTEASISKLSDSISFNQVFWLDDNGKEIFNWMNEKVNAPHGDFSPRNYFINTKNSKFYFIDEDTSKLFYLDQGVSWTTGQFRTLISTRSSNSNLRNILVIGLSFNMKTLDSVVLPAGYSFAIIDKSGNVLYHSDKTRNLNENLIEEFSSNNRLTSAITARAKDIFVTDYYGREFNTLVEPIKDLPYYIVILSDATFKETKDTEIYSFTISMFLLLFFFLILEFILVVLVSAKRSYLDKSGYIVDWIWPRKSFNEIYLRAAFAHLAIIGLLIAFFYLTDFPNLFFILPSSIIGGSIFLNSLYIRKYKEQGNILYLNFKSNTRWAMIFLLVFINIAAVFEFGIMSFFVSYFFLFEMANLCILLFFYFTYNPSKNSDNQSGKLKLTYSYSYTLMAVTKLIITSGIPVIFLYTFAYNYEQNLLIRYRQLDFANQFLNKYSNNHSLWLKNDSVLSSDKQNTFCKKNFVKGVYNDGAWIKDVSIIDESEIPKTPSKENLTSDFTAYLLNLFRFYQNTIASNSKNLYKDSSYDSAIRFNSMFKESIIHNDALHASKTYYPTSVPSKYLEITSSPLNYTFPSIFGESPLYGISFWILFLIALVIFYFVLHYIVKTMFAVALPVSPDPVDWEKKVNEELLTDEKGNGLFFIIGVPGSGKLAYIRSKITPQETVLSQTLPNKENNFENDKICVIDMFDKSAQIAIEKKTSEEHPNAIFKLIQIDNGKKQPTKIIPENCEWVIINNFEYDFKDEQENLRKIKLLEDLMTSKKKQKIVILSSVHPTAFLDSLQGSGSNEKENKINYELLIDRWTSLLGHFKVIILPIMLDEEIKKIINLKERKWSHNEDENFTVEQKTNLLKEIQYGSLLKKMKTIIKQLPDIEGKNLDDMSNAIAYKIQLVAQNYYMYIWYSLTKEEKFLLYDLAEDWLVNSCDSYNLGMLIAKGIIIRNEDRKLELFNKGFRNFILGSIGNIEATKIQNQIKDSGHWNRLRIPLMIVIISILAFLLSSQEETYSKIVTYLGTLVTGILTFTRFFGFFEGKETKNT